MSRRGAASTKRFAQSTFVDDVVERSGRVADDVQPADDRAHARAGDVVDRDAQLLEDLEHADVRVAAGAAAAEGQADLRAAGGASLGGRGLRRHGSSRGQGRKEGDREVAREGCLHLATKPIATPAGPRSGAGGRV